MFRKVSTFGTPKVKTIAKKPRKREVYKTSRWLLAPSIEFALVAGRCSLTKRPCDNPYTFWHHYSGITWWQVARKYHPGDTGWQHNELVLVGRRGGGNNTGFIPRFASASCWMWLSEGFVGVEISHTCIVWLTHKGGVYKVNILYL